MPCVQPPLDYDAWLQYVKRREERERRRARFMEQEENMFLRVRSPEECERAFRLYAADPIPIRIRRPALPYT